MTNPTGIYWLDITIALVCIASPVGIGLWFCRNIDKES